MVLTGIMQKDILVNKHKYKKNNLALFLSFFFFFPQHNVKDFCTLQPSDPSSDRFLQERGIRFPG